MLHYTRLFIRLLYIKGDSYATVHTAPSVKRTRDRTLNMRTRAYQGDSYTHKSQYLSDQLYTQLDSSSDSTDLSLQ